MAAEERPVVRARARYVRCAPRKARLVIDHIRGRPVEEARALLAHTPRAASKDVLELLESAIANAENNHDLDVDRLYVAEASVGKALVMKRFAPRARGRVNVIRKPFSRLRIVVRERQEEAA